MKHLLKLSLFLMLALATALNAAADYAYVTVNGIIYEFDFHGTGASAVADYAIVWSPEGEPWELIGAANIASSVTYRYTYTTTDGQTHTRYLTAPVTYIRPWAFYCCTNLTSVNIPNSVNDIGDEAFAICTSLKSINIPNSVTTIGENAFRECSSLTSVTIPSSVTTIPFSCFALCRSLTSVTIGSSVSVIDEQAFGGCRSLTSINIPNSVKIIGGGAFNNCGLTSVTIPKSVTYVGVFAFGKNNNMTRVICEAPTPPTAFEDTFYDYYSTATLYVPAGSLSAYKTTVPWSYFYNTQPIGQEEYSVTLDETNLVMEKGDVFHLKATVTPNDDNAPSVTWSSSNSNVASVNDMGFVTAEGTGTATITARAGNATATCQVRVVEHTVTLDQSEVTLPIYNTVQLHATVTPHDGYEPPVEWSSSRPGVATVSANGLVKGYMTGTATITAKVGQSTATCVVTVIPVYATGLTLSSYQEEMEVGQSTRIVAYISPSDVSNRQVSWSVTGSDVAHCSWSGNECTILAMKAGTATVTATTTDGTNLSASCQITVRGSDPIFIPVESISVRPTSVRMTVGATQQLRTIILPADATNKKVRWTSGNSSVVTVTSEGLIKALNTGTANVIARTTDGTNLSATCAVTVVAGGGGDEVLPGDVNGDGEINITDVTMLIFALLNDDFSDINMENADVNGDGMVNITDVVTLIYNLLNGTYER